MLSGLFGQFRKIKKKLSKIVVIVMKIVVRTFLDHFEQFLIFSTGTHTSGVFKLMLTMAYN